MAVKSSPFRIEVAVQFKRTFRFDNNKQCTSRSNHTYPVRWARAFNLHWSTLCCHCGRFAVAFGSKSPVYYRFLSDSVPVCVCVLSLHLSIYLISNLSAEKRVFWNNFLWPFAGYDLLFFLFLFKICFAAMLNVPVYKTLSVCMSVCALTLCTLGGTVFFASASKKPSTEYR